MFSDCKPIFTFLQNAVLASAFGMLLFNLKEFDLAEVSVIFSEWAAHWQSVAMDMVSVRAFSYGISYPVN